MVESRVWSHSPNFQNLEHHSTENMESERLNEMKSVASFSALPKELISLILDYDAVSCGQLYQLRFLSRGISALAARAYVKRVRFMLVVDKDVDTFVGSWRLDKKMAPTTTDEENEQPQEETPIPPLRAGALGRLLTLSGVPIDSFCVFDIAQRIWATVDDTKSVELMAAFYYGMKPTLRDLRLALRGFGFLKDDDNSRAKMRRLIAWNNLPEVDLVALCLSLTSLSFSTRFKILVEILKLVDAASIEHLRKNIWPKVVEATVKEYGTSSRALYGQLCSCLRVLNNLPACHPKLLSRFFVPFDPLSIADVVQIFVLFNAVDLEYLHCYFNDEDDEDDGFPPPQPSDLVSMEQSRAFFREFGKHDKFLKLLVECLIYDSWPKHVDPNHPKLEDVPHLNDSRTVSRILAAMKDERVYYDDELSITETVISMRKFVEANPLNRDKWIRWTRDRMDELCESELTTVEEEMSRSHDRLWVSLLLEGLETAAPVVSAALEKGQTTLSFPQK